MRKFETSDYVVEFDDSQNIKDAVFEELIKFYKRNESFNGESVQQNDDCIINAPEVLGDIADRIIKFQFNWKEEP